MNQKDFETIQLKVAENLVSIAEKYRSIPYDDFRAKCWNYRTEEAPEHVALYELFHTSEHHANFVLNRIIQE